MSSTTSQVDHEYTSYDQLMPAEKAAQQPRGVNHGSRLEQGLQPGWGHLAELEYIVAMVQQDDSTIILLMPNQTPCSSTNTGLH